MFRPLKSDYKKLNAAGILFNSQLTPLLYWLQNCNKEDRKLSIDSLKSISKALESKDKVYNKHIGRFILDKPIRDAFVSSMVKAVKGLVGKEAVESEATINQVVKDNLFVDHMMATHVLREIKKQATAQWSDIGYDVKEEFIQKCEKLELSIQRKKKEKETSDVLSKTFFAETDDDAEARCVRMATHSAQLPERERTPPTFESEFKPDFKPVVDVQIETLHGVKSIADQLPSFEHMSKEEKQALVKELTVVQLTKEEESIRKNEIARQKREQTAGSDTTLTMLEKELASRDKGKK